MRMGSAKLEDRSSDDKLFAIIASQAASIDVLTVRLDTQAAQMQAQRFQM
jgi:hypothetical protein